MSALIVRERVLVLPDHRDVECARRALLADGRPVPREAVVEATWVTRALPVILDLLADARCDIAQERVQLCDMELALFEPDAAGRGRALAVHKPGTDRLEVRFVDAALETVAVFLTRLSLEVAAGEEGVLIRRFTHGRGS